MWYLQDSDSATCIRGQNARIIEIYFTGQTDFVFVRFEKVYETSLRPHCLNYRTGVHRLAKAQSDPASAAEEGILILQCTSVPT
jgi:hypothetical protein